MAKIRIVRAADGRQWMVRQKLEWTDPATGEDFEHDMEGGRLASIGIVSIMGLLWFALLAWWFTGSQGVVVPCVGVADPAPGRRVLPRTVGAAPPAHPRGRDARAVSDGSAPERWVGWVRGTTASP